VGGDELDIMEDRMYSAVLSMANFNYAIGYNARAWQGQGKMTSVEVDELVDP
jgi:hypothetical protein